MNPCKMVRGMCGMHYRRWKRGTLHKPRYQRPRGSIGMVTEWPYEFTKIGDDWHRRPTGSNEPWALVVWAPNARRVA